MSLFSERNGYVSPRDVFQLESVDNELRTSVYNALFQWLDIMDKANGRLGGVVKDVWAGYWRKPLDEMPDRTYWFQKSLKDYCEKCDWFGLYDVIEAIAASVDAEQEEWGYGYPQQLSKKDKLDLLGMLVNEALEREHSGYRYVEKVIVPITNKDELSSLEAAAAGGGLFSGAGMHMRSALAHIAAKPEPDYRNAVKEAISAVESAAKAFAGSDSGTLADAVKILKRDYNLHPALADGWLKLYGFTNDEGGIRHSASNDEVKVDFALAKYMVVTASAFVNYLADWKNSPEVR